MSEPHVPSKERVAIERNWNRVYVVETRLRGFNRRWQVWSTHLGIKAAHAAMRMARSKYPGERFRTIAYDSTVNSNA